jgi:branched-chain amino acid transport system permease protein
VSAGAAVQAPAPAAPARRGRRRPPAAGLWGGLLLLAVVTVVVTQALSDYNIFLYNTCLLVAMGAIALNVQLGTAGQVSLGNGAFLAVGAFVTAALSRAGIGFPWSVLIAAVVSGAAGLLIAIPALRLKGLYFALATVSAFFIVYFFCNSYQTNTVGESGFSFAPVFPALSYHGVQTAWAWLLTGVLAVVVIGASVMTKGKTGRSLRIIRDHELAAPAFGVRVVRAKLLVFGLGFAVIGLQGGLTAYYTGLVTVDSFTLTLSVQYLAMVIIGGLDSIPGAVIGAAIVTILPTLTTNLMQGSLSNATVQGPQIAVVIYGALVIVFVTSSAGGIAGWARSVRQLAARRLGR